MAKMKTARTRRSRRAAVKARAFVPPYAALAATLRQRMAAGEHPAGSWLGTEVEIAAKAGLSRMTARRAVQTLVDEGLLERRAGRGIFVPEAKASARARIVRFLAGNLLWAPAVRVAHAVQESAAGLGLEVSVFDACGDLSAFLRALAALPDGGAAGAIVMSQHDAAFNRALAGLVAADFPFVVVDQALSDLPAPSVASDNRAGGRLAAEALLAAGHRDIAFLGDLAADTTAARAQGVADACAAALVPPPAVYDIPGQRFENWEPAIARRVGEILAAPRRPTAIACSCDAVALHAIRALAAAGVAVPRDMSVTGFDDDPIAEWSSPPLTTVRQDFAAMGRAAASVIAAALDEKAAAQDDAPAPAHAATAVALVARGSISAPPAVFPETPGSAREHSTATDGDRQHSTTL